MLMNGFFYFIFEYNGISTESLDTVDFLRFFHFQHRQILIEEDNNGKYTIVDYVYMDFFNYNQHFLLLTFL